MNRHSIWRAVLLVCTVVALLLGGRAALAQHVPIHQTPKASTPASSLTNHRITPSPTRQIPQPQGLIYNNVFELAKLESSITAVLAGFSLTICVMIFQSFAKPIRRKPNEADIDHAKREKSALDSSEPVIMLFFASFFSGLASSVMYASVVGDFHLLITSDVVPTDDLILFLPPTLCFALGVVLMLYGLYWISRIVSFGNVTKYCLHLVHCGGVLSNLYILSTVIDTVSTLRAENEVAMIWSHGNVFLIAVDFFLPFITLIFRHYRPFKFSLSVFCHISTYVIAACGVSAVFIAHLPPGFDYTGLWNAWICPAYALLFSVAVSLMFLTTEAKSDFNTKGKRRRPNSPVHIDSVSSEQKQTATPS